VLSRRVAVQPWDRRDQRPVDAQRVSALVAGRRAKVLAETLGHYPAPLAILDCVEQGFPQNFDDAIQTEMKIFAKLIQRREPRNMIRTLFLGRLDHERLKKKGMNPKVVEAVAAIAGVVGAPAESDQELSQAFARAGFRVDGGQKPIFDGQIAGAAYWFEDEPKTRGKALLRARLADAEAAAARWRSEFDEAERRAADYLLVTQKGFPAYLGGLFATGLS
jgi:3-hydroxyacyl-CoA dehydrogenase / enoyl-CoA hydratase / 3-hydroxybutyryl-CoA epimerase